MRGAEGASAEVEVAAEEPSAVSQAAAAVAKAVSAAAGAGAAAKSERAVGKPALQATEAMKQSCQGTLGTWCIEFVAQAEVPAVTAPRGSQKCSLDCNKASGQAAAGRQASYAACTACMGAGGGNVSRSRGMLSASP